MRIIFKNKYRFVFEKEINPNINGFVYKSRGRPDGAMPRQSHHGYELLIYLFKIHFNLDISDYSLSDIEINNNDASIIFNIKDEDLVKMRDDTLNNLLNL